MTRNATLNDLVAILKDENARKLDVVVPATSIRSKDGQLIVTGAEQQITEDGVTTVDGTYIPTVVCDEGLASKLDIPPSYLKRLRNEAPDLYDANTNGWLRGKSVRRATGTEIVRPADDRSFMLRAFRGVNGGPGVARALLSNSYARMDNLDVLTAALAGVRASGVEIKVSACDLTDRRMYVDVYAPAVAAMAPILLGGYRNPFDDPKVQAQREHGSVNYWRQVAEREGQGYAAGSEPVVFSGFRISNSEVGGGAFSIVPKLMVKICRNGLVVNQDAIRNVHLGARLEDGLIKWSDATQRKTLDLITSKTTDAVKTFLDEKYLIKVLTRIEKDAGKPVDTPADSIKVIGKALGFTEAEQSGILDHFIRGGQMTAGGVVNAVTSFSQTVSDADRAHKLDSDALRVLSLA